MADDNRPLKYARYAIGEVVLVVIGILIALQINNWNEESKIESIRQGYYSQIIIDLDKDRAYGDNLIIKLDSNLVKLKTYRETYKEPNLPLIQILGNTGKLDWFAKNVHFQSNTIETLENTGDIQLIPISIRNKLINYNREQNQIASVSKTNNDLYTDVLSKAVMLYGGNDYVENIGNQPKLLQNMSDEKLQAQLLLNLEAGQLFKKISESQTSESLKRLKLDIDEIKKLISEQIKK